MISLFDDILLDLERNNLEIWGEYTKSEKLKIDKLNQKIGVENASHCTLFRDAEFVRNFLEIISDQEEQYQYFENTYDN